MVGFLFTSQRHADSDPGSATTQNKILSYVVGFITVIVTVAAMWYIQKQINRVKPEIIYARRKARQVVAFPL